jgi:hypothetical protein
MVATDNVKMGARISLRWEPIPVGEGLFRIHFEAELRIKRRPKVVDSGPDVGVYVFLESN